MAVLLGADLLIWAGFFALMPYLPAQMTDLGFSGLAVGLILALRLLSQQGTMPLTGALADRWGYRRTLVMGLALRAWGFALMAEAASVYALGAAAVLSGLGGSLLGAALKASYTAAPGTADLGSRFVWLAVADRLGQVVGPLAAALAGSFAGKAYLAVTFYVVVGLAVWVRQPPHTGSTSQPLLRNVLAQFRNRRLFWLVAVLCGYWAVQQQMSVLVPLAAARAGFGKGVGVGSLFSLSALAGLALMMVLPRIRPDRLWSRIALGQGLTIAAIAVPAVLPGMAGIVGATAGLAVAAVIAQPAMDALVGLLSTAESRASAYGFAALSFGVGGAVGQVLGGWAWSRWGELAPWLPWLLFAAVGLLTLAGIRAVRKEVDGHERVA